MSQFFIRATVDEWHNGDEKSNFVEEYWIEAVDEESALAFFDELHEDRTQDFESLYFDLPEVLEVR